MCKPFTLSFWLLKRIPKYSSSLKGRAAMVDVVPHVVITLPVQKNMEVGFANPTHHSHLSGVYCHIVRPEVLSVYAVLLQGRAHG